MKNKIKRVLALALSLALLLSLVGCKTQPPEKDNVAGSTVSEPSTDVVVDTQDAQNGDDSNSSDPKNYLEPEDFGDIIDIPSDSYDDFEGGDLGDIDTDEPSEETEDTKESLNDYDSDYKNPIQQYGNAVKGNTRTIKVELDNSVWKNFHGFGACYFTQNYTTHNYTNLKFTQASFALDKERFTSDAAHIARVWFSLDFMITNEQEEIPLDYEDNKDYQNYINGIYSFDNEEMRSFWSYMDVWKEAGTDVAINFGWITDTRIQSWFSIPGVNKPSNSAPNDLAAFSRACVALLDEMERRGYDNATKYITFFNEPTETNMYTAGDYNCISDPIVYFSSMMRYIDKEFKKTGWDKKLEVWCGENHRISQGSQIPSDYMYANAKNYFDTMTFHLYGYDSFALLGNQEYGSDYSVYSAAYHIFSWLKNSYRKRNIYVTEYYNTPSLKTYSETYKWNDWGNSNAGYFIAASNCGIGATLKWTTVSGYNCRQSNLYLTGSGLGHYGVAVNGLYDNNSIHRIEADAYFDLLAIWYIPDGSEVLKQTWTGEDIRVSAYKYKDDYTFLIEANESTIAKRKIDFSLNKSLGGKTIYRYSYNPLTQECNGNGTVPTSDKQIKNVKKSFTDTIGKDYACYFYSTIKPIKQIELENIELHCKVGESVNLNAKMIDCDDNDKIKYEVVAKSVAVGVEVPEIELGTVDENGNYTPDSSAKSPDADGKNGDYFAVKAYLESNPKIHAIATVYID